MNVHAGVVSMRSFHVDAVVPIASMYYLRVQDRSWMQVCHIPTFQVCKCFPACLTTLATAEYHKEILTAHSGARANGTR
jgi:hypothetical protein